MSALFPLAFQNRLDFRKRYALKAFLPPRVAFHSALASEEVHGRQAEVLNIMRNILAERIAQSLKKFWGKKHFHVMTLQLWRTSALKVKDSQ